MAAQDAPSPQEAGDELGAALTDLDATEAAELEELGVAIGDALRGSSPPPLDPAKVDELWTRVEADL